MTTQAQDLVGATRKESRRLLDGWWQEMTGAAGGGRPAAYVFVMGSFNEILRVFDFVINFPEVTALQTAVRGQSMTYLQAAEDYGFSPDICGYVKVDVGLQLKGGEHPHGRVPPPALVLATNMCNTYVKWAEFWEHYYRCPVFVLDLPAWRGGGATPDPADPAFQSDRRYVEGQLRELIALCERVTGRPFDIDRLREAMAETNRMATAYHEVLALNRQRPAPFNAAREGITYQGIANLYRGTPEGTRFFALARDELRERVRLGLGTVADEKFRLLLAGTACYTHFKRFVELFESWGGVFVLSTYMIFAGGGFIPGFGYDLARPLESLAEQMLQAAWWGFTGSMFYPQEWLAGAVRDWAVDGICLHGVKSCRTTSTGLPDVREWLRIQHDVPGLFIQSDLVDARLWSDAQIKNRVDAFFEALAARKVGAGR
ncbi:MAG: 2-hydroxyacyl-CoA dehydratase family protein [Armatimonadota bacterium]|nr:2-hydroxyacyl-CoA dehydratase family protein [Armatimonadota bacterium]MDR7486039.1 2-hydroxyacyl-CoA dehydratase family protein [Armatimonadota bacterium]MDR7532610.1 2-hydroxyacyl-CoA dehydratase family protein [Armatimonadota bacterium]